MPGGRVREASRATAAGGVEAADVDVIFADVHPGEGCAYGVGGSEWIGRLVHNGQRAYVLDDVCSVRRPVLVRPADIVGYAGSSVRISGDPSYRGLVYSSASGRRTRRGADITARLMPNRLCWQASCGCSLPGPWQPTKRAQHPHFRDTMCLHHCVAFLIHESSNP